MIVLTPVILLFSGPMYDKFEELEELGQVAFSEVVMVRHNRDSHTYAIKRSHMKFTQKAVLLEFEDVVQTLCRLSHKNIVQYRTSFHNDEGHFRVLKECCDKDLSACFHSKFDMTNYIKPRLIKIFTDIVAGLEYLHSKKIIHRDLKPANILLYSLHDKCDAKIGGFGLSCHGNQSVGSSRYWAPEQPSGKYDSKADMYSAGVILFELSKLEWGDPDDETDSWEKSLRDLRTNVRKQLKKYEPFYPKCVKWIIASLLQENPKKRLNTSQVLQELGRFSNKEYSYPMPEQCSGSPGM